MPFGSKRKGAAGNGPDGGSDERAVREAVALVDLAAVTLLALRMTTLT